MGDLKGISDEMARVLVAASVVRLPPEWATWPPSTRFGWLSQVTGQIEQEILTAFGAVL